jgi:YVTN family beta-propeller protein
MTRRRRRAGGALAVTVLLIAGSCSDGDGLGGSPDLTVGPDSEETTVATTVPAVPAIPTVAGMPPVVDPTNLYSEAGAGALSPATDGALSRVYVPNGSAGTVSVIDPATFQVVDAFPSGSVPQHVVPSYDLRTLFVLNNSGNSLVPIDPLTARPGPAIAVTDPYNLYFTPDGSEAIVVAEALRRLDFTDPHSFEVHSSLQTDCVGLNHVDFSIDGTYAIATCEFDGRLIKIDMTTRQVVGAIQIDIGVSGKSDPVKSVAQPQDVRASPDGSRFYVADLVTDGVYVIDGASFTQIGFIPTGVGTHGLYPSRDASVLYVVNRGTNLTSGGSPPRQGSVTVLDWSTDQVIAQWVVPEGGSPDMGNVTADGTQLWLAGRYDDEVYVFDTATGGLMARIPVGSGPHGLAVWPQPGRYSLGHTGNMR